MRNLYSVLGVSRRASAKDIRRAYYALAHKMHPDKHPEQADAAERFQEGVYAYAVLSQPNYRRLYDRFGNVALQALPLGRAPGRQVALAPWGMVASLVKSVASGVQARVAQFDAARAQAARGVDEPVAVRVGPSVLWVGGTITVPARRSHACSTCQGSGAAPGSRSTPCPLCETTGRVGPRLGGLLSDSPCIACQGRGALIAARCRACRGSGHVYRYAPLRVRVPAHTPHDVPFRVPGRGGAPRRDGGLQGDLLLSLCVVDETDEAGGIALSVEGSDVHVRWAISAAEAAHGAQVAVPLAGGAVELKVPAGLKNGTRVTVAGAGLPRAHGANGALHITLGVGPQSRP